MKKFIKFLLTVIVAAILVLVWMIFVPRSYNVMHLKGRAGTKYWELSTGSRIAYTFLPASGNKHPYPVIYLHGGPGAGITDREIKVYGEIAASGYDVYLYDQVGCGYSNRLENINDYTADRQRRDLEEIVKKIGVEKIILAGQSWGSILAVMFVAENPSKVDKLIITAPAPIQPARKELELIQPPDSLHLRPPYFSNKMGNEKTANLRSKMMYYLARHGIRLIGDREADEFATYLTNELNKSMVCDTSKAVTAEGTEGMYVQYMTAKSLGKVKDPRPAIRKIGVPVLIMKAQCDNQPWGYTTEYLELFTVHQLVVVPGAGHNIFLEQPGKYVREILEFLNREPSTVNREP